MELVQRIDSVRPAQLLMAAHLSGVDVNPPPEGWWCPPRRSWRRMLCNCNLVAYLQWAEIAPDDHAEVHADCPLLLHRVNRIADDPSTLLEGDELLLDDPPRANHRPMPQRPCDSPNCERCEMRLGGVAFPWVGPWTDTQMFIENLAPLGRIHHMVYRRYLEEVGERWEGRFPLEYTCAQAMSSPFGLTLYEGMPSVRPIYGPERLFMFPYLPTEVEPLCIVARQTYFSTSGGWTTRRTGQPEGTYVAP